MCPGQSPNSLRYCLALFPPRRCADPAAPCNALASGNTRVTKYEGTLSGEELKLKVTRETQNGPMTSDVTAKRSTT